MRFTKDHEWVDLVGDVATVGITNYAAEQLGDVVFVELPAIGTALTAGAAMGVVESVKAASEVFAPVGGQVAEVNTALADNPETVNDQPEGQGWFVKITGVDAAAVDALMDHAGYEAYLASL